MLSKVWKRSDESAVTNPWPRDQENGNLDYLRLKEAVSD